MLCVWNGPTIIHCPTITQPLMNNYLAAVGKKNPNFFRSKPLRLAGSTDRALQNELQWGSWPKCQKQSAWWWHEGLTSFCGKCAHNWLTFAWEHLTTGSTKTGALFSSQLKGGSRKVHVTDMKQSGGANVMLPAASCSMTPLALGHWWCAEQYIWRVTQTSTC